MKKLLLLLFVSVLIVLTALSSSAAGYDLENSLEERLFSELGEEFTEALEGIGITELDYSSIFNISFKSIFDYFSDGLKGYFQGLLKVLTKLLAIILLAVGFTFFDSEEKYKSLLVALFIPIITIILVGEINTAVSSALSLMKLNGHFMVTFVPIYAVAVSVAGNPATALTYNSIVLTFAEIISALINYVFINIIGCYFSLSVSFSINKSVNFSRFINAVNRFISFSLGLLSTIFASVLSVKGIFSAATDSIASKGIRFAIGSLIPVIGSSISDAYSTLLGSIGIIKSSIAIIGILAVILINVPVLAELILLNISLNMLSFLSELFDCTEISNVLKAFACGIKITGLLVVFEMFVIIISTAIMLSLRGG